VGKRGLIKEGEEQGIDEGGCVLMKKEMMTKEEGLTVVFS